MKIRNLNRKLNGFTLVEFLVALTILTFITLAIGTTFKIIGSVYTDTNDNVNTVNTIETIYSNFDKFKYIDTDIVINSTADPNTATDKKLVQDELYITDRYNPSNYLYIIFKDGKGYIVKGDKSETTLLLKGVVSMSIRKVNKLLTTNDSVSGYVNVDSNKELIELVVEFENGTVIRVLKAFSKATS